MKKQSIVIIGVLLISLFLSCTQADKTDVAAQIAEIERIYQDSLNALRQKLSDANDKIEILSYPADQRLASIDELFKSGDYVGVRKEAAELKRVFPNAKENDSSNEYLKKIEAIEAAKKAEEERIKSLGFKAIAEQATVKINYNTVTFSNFTIGKNYIHDSYGDRYFYNDADRGHKYISVLMSVKSDDHNPEIPQLAVYIIRGDKMQLEGTFRTEFNRWEDYSTYLGNYHDSHNDFAKVNTVKFKLGLEVSDEVLKEPYAIVLMKKNVLTRENERFRNPPVYYSGDADYPYTLSVSDFTNKYIIVKRYNLK
jgi:hypothetical protein